jgi:hypothetical protein
MTYLKVVGIKCQAVERKAAALKCNTHLQTHTGLVEGTFESTAYLALRLQIGKRYNKACFSAGQQLLSAPTIQGIA